MAEIEALLFDLDGTLVDTAEANFAAYAAALSEAGIAVEREAFDRASHGRHWRQFLPGLIGSAGANPAEIAARKRVLYPTMTGRTRLNQPLVNFAKAQRNRVKLGVVTNASRPSATAVLARHNLEGLFGAIVTADDVEHPKPWPDGYLLAASRLGVETNRCMAIEDSDTGLESARRAGMRAVRIAFPF